MELSVRYNHFDQVNVELLWVPFGQARMGLDPLPVYASDFVELP